MTCDSCKREIIGNPIYHLRPRYVTCSECEQLRLQARASLAQSPREWGKK